MLNRNTGTQAKEKYMSKTIAGIRVPDSQLATEATELLRASASPMLFNHSLRVYMFGALHGARHGRSVDHELLYLGAVFHDFGLIKKYSSPKERFELDGANAARRFLVERGVPQTSVEIVWDAIALHNTLEIPKYKRPEIELVYEGVQRGRAGYGFSRNR
jgi:HD superfamily phosphodiesterase